MFQLEIALVRIVIGRDFVVGESRIDPVVDVVLFQLADQQRLPVFLDHPVDVLDRGGKEHFGLLDFELLAHPPIHIDLQKRHAVVARDPRGNHRLHVALPQFLAPGTREQGILVQVGRQFLTRRQRQQPGGNPNLSSCKNRLFPKH